MASPRPAHDRSGGHPPQRSSWSLSLFPSTPLRLVLLGVIFHLVYLLAMFDTYFHSPIIPIDIHHHLPSNLIGADTQSIQNSAPPPSPPADRVVLIVADGLRADLLYTPHAFDHLSSSNPHISFPSDGVVAPHLRSIIQHRGSYGLSWTRVPTESRPGHVAIIAGIWEDPSAVFKGWKHNPVHFDSVFNHSRTTFSFGSPDILPIFGDPPPKQARERRDCLKLPFEFEETNEDARESWVPDEFLCSGSEDDPLDEERNVLMWMYNPDAEDFTNGETTQVDYFVLNKLKALLHRAKTDKFLKSRLRQPQTFFFLHLLGLDSAGHGWGPHSVEYMHNIQAVDDIVRQVETLFQDFYDNDGRTAFVFTADHGMSNIGNHGDGHPDNTRTPYIAWGSGLRGPTADSVSKTSHDSTSTAWDLSSLRRKDIDQVDLNALMTGLGASEWSANSVGILPTELLDNHPGSEKVKSDLLLVNSKALCQHLQAKHDLKSTHRLRMVPFSRLPDGGQSDLSRSERLIDAGHYEEAQTVLSTLIDSALEGLTYYDTYDRRMLQAIVTVGYLSFGVYVLMYCIVHYSGIGLPSSASTSREPRVDYACLAITVLWSILCLYQRTTQHILYIGFPLYFVRGIITILSRLPHSMTSFKQPSFALQIVGILGFVAMLVHGYANRSVWTWAYLALAPTLPYLRRLEPTTRSKSKYWLFDAAWVAACAVGSYWATLPVERSEDVSQIIAGSLQFLLLTAIFSLNSHRLSKSFITIFGIQTILLALTQISVWTTVLRLQQKVGLGLITEICNWTLLGLGVAAPVIGRISGFKDPGSRLLSYGMAFNSAYTLLSVSWETQFLSSFFAILLLWMYGESEVKPNEQILNKCGYRPLVPADGLRALIFLTLVHCAFFGTGNVASIASFYLAPVYRLVPVFNPGIMSVLLMFKLIIPYLLLGSVFAVITHEQKTPPFAVILLMLAMTEPMCLIFFLSIRTTGSWLEIGSSISHFSIATLLVAYSVTMYVIGDRMMGKGRLIRTEGNKDNRGS